jgi:hypothetical protein
VRSNLLAILVFSAILYACKCWWLAVDGVSGFWLSWLLVCGDFLPFGCDVLLARRSLPSSKSRVFAFGGVYVLWYS